MIPYGLAYTAVNNNSGSVMTNNLVLASAIRRSLPFGYRLGLEKTASFIPEDRFVDFPGWVVYARKRSGTHLQDVHL